MLAAALAALLSVLGPARDAAPTTERGFDRLPGFSELVGTYADATLGMDALPRGTGQPLERGLLLAIGTDRVWAFEREIGALKNRVFAERDGAPECAGRCPASLFLAMRSMWLSLAIESTQRTVEIPARIAVLAHREVPARTMLQAMYAAAVSRPVRPPDLALVLATQGRGLQSQPFFALPPEGLELDQGSAVLGLRIDFGRDRFQFSAADDRYLQDTSVSDLKRVPAVLAAVKKKHPGKEAIILVPDETVTVGELVALMMVVRPEFPLIVLSLGQDLDLP